MFPSVLKPSTTIFSKSEKYYSYLTETQWWLLWVCHGSGRIKFKLNLLYQLLYLFNFISRASKNVVYTFGYIQNGKVLLCWTLLKPSQFKGNIFYWWRLVVHTVAANALGFKQKKSVRCFINALVTEKNGNALLFQKRF